MSVKQTAIDDARKRIQEYEQSIELLEQLPDGPFDFLVNIHVLGDTVHITLPYDPIAYKTYRLAMGKGWKCGGWSTTSHNGHASRSRPYWPRGRKYCGPTVLLSLNTGLSGSICRIEQIGVEESPIYKIVCE